MENSIFDVMNRLIMMHFQLSLESVQKTKIQTSSDLGWKIESYWIGNDYVDGKWNSFFKNNEGYPIIVYLIRWDLTIFFFFFFINSSFVIIYVVTCVVTVQYGFDICYIVLFSLFEYFSSVRKQVCSQTLKSCDQKKDFFITFPADF